MHVIDKFTDDEQTKHLKTVLLLKIGGGGGYEGIHGAHMGPGVDITYGHSDEKTAGLSHGFNIRATATKPFSKRTVSKTAI